jgi:hypothetical protein
MISFFFLELVIFLSSNQKHALQYLQICSGIPIAHMFPLDAEYNQLDMKPYHDLMINKHE